MRLKVTLTSDDGIERDITEDFQLLWDIVTGSMDWGSGFLDLEDYLKIVRVGMWAGFKVDDLIPISQVMTNPPGVYSWNESRDDYAQRRAKFEAYVHERLAAFDQVDPANPEDVG